MTIKFHTFYTDDLPSYIPDLHKEVCNSFGYEVNYHVEKKKPKNEKEGYFYPGYREHGEFMDDVLKNSEEEVVAMIQQGQEAAKNKEPSAEDKKKLAEANLADVRAKQIQAEVAGEDAESQLDFMSMAAGDPKVYS